MRPVTFEGCFGWLHQAAPGPIGVVICGSWEYEALATHQSLRVLADRLAAAGVPTLRFDYPGCGDSLGDSEAAGAFDAAARAIGGAIGALRERAGVARVALVGLRLGGALAMSAAASNEVAAVALIRPVTRGRSYLSEQRALAKIIAAREGPTVLRTAEPGALEIEGFRLSAESLEKIGRIDVAAAEGPAPGRVLIAGEHGSAQYDSLHERLVARGAHVTRLDLADVAGWAPASIPTPPPLADADAIAAWVRSSDEVKPLRPAVEPGLETASFAETAIAFGGAHALTGILCRPNRAGAGPTRRVVVFLNTGANSHIGMGRTAVEHARGLAERGIASLRMDCLGIGDSAWLPEGPLGSIHHVERTVDVSAAIDLLRGMNFEEISLVGVCSGAFLAFQTALSDPRVDRLMLTNPQFWLPPSPEQLVDPMQGAYGSTSGYVSKLFSAATWRRLVKGEVRLGTFPGVAREIASRQWRKLGARLEPILAKLPGREAWRGALVARLQKLAARDCRILLVLSESDPARELLASHLPGGDLTAIEGLMRVVTVKGADHAFAMKRTRAEFRALLAEFVDPRAEADEPALREKAA